ncbi:MAG: hypothetical protein A2984_02970 [Omnitrophica WOR_2 bacterium RIFCSPLOWO2_01_FULL_41_12]|nr:MAG: hypothetical protein A2984_02970 [Omnitrophica WOR_2 bacterium RIFCSPLOWO2_01_FULL_41_12]
MKSKNFIDYFLIFILGIIVYFNSLWVNFTWDDLGLILNNAQLKSFSNIFKNFSSGLFYSKVFYRPIQTLTYMLDFFLYKFNYKGYHLTSIILHILVVILSYKLLIILTKNRRLSLLTSLLYLVSPLWVESVTYISGRADILMAIFILLSFIFFIKDKFFPSIIFFIFALLSKEASLIFPLVLILYLFLFGKKEKKTIFSIIAFFIIDIGYVAFRYLTVGYENINFQKYPFYSRILFFIKAIPKYIGLMFFPINQHMAHAVNLPVSFFKTEVWLSFLFLIFLVFLFFYFLKKERFISFFIAWFFIFLLPQSGILPINAFFAEHFIYISALGIFVIFIYFLQKLRPKIAFNTLFLAFLSFFSLATVKYNFIWQDPIKFYKRIIGFSANSFTAYNNLGNIYLNNGNLKDAEKMIKKSLEIHPQYKQGRLSLARIYYLKQDFSKAIDLVKSVLTEDPKNYLALYFLGVFYTKKESYDLAEGYYKKAIELNPSYMLLWLDLYSLYQLSGKEEEAGRTKEIIAQMDKYSLSQVYSNDAAELLEKNKLDEALFTINEAIKINSSDSNYYNLRGVILRKKGDYPQALNNCKMAIKISPSNWEVYNNLGIIFSKMGDFNNAEKNFQKAISLNENYTEAHFNLGLLKKQFQK